MGLFLRRLLIYLGKSESILLAKFVNTYSEFVLPMFSYCYPIMFLYEGHLLLTYSICKLGYCYFYSDTSSTNLYTAKNKDKITGQRQTHKHVTVLLKYSIIKYPNLEKPDLKLPFFLFRSVMMRDASTLRHLFVWLL